MVSKKAPKLKLIGTTWAKKAGKPSLARVETRVIIMIIETAITIDLLVLFQCQSSHGGANVRLFKVGVWTFCVVGELVGHVRPVLTP